MEKSPYHHHHKETHGMRTDIDDNTPLSDVKAPNMFERAKEEIEALVQSIHPKKESPPHEMRDQSVDATSKTEHSNSSGSDDGKTTNFIKRAKEDLEEFIHSKTSHHHHHHRETHGMSDDINENTPIGHVKGPNVLERAKEEIEALVLTIHPKKESSHSPTKEGSFRQNLGKGLEKVLSPWGP
ncbi:hypothetical protein SAY87_019049 [Trapa incisa]|uniref:Uncharacterized protein n=1 Tax=Trapa incisa TaxID=236973 RepID=A0AAN7K547_9MYRT|nr:hypothetical protein SAY87_019049 [Trapa incisa]